ISPIVATVLLIAFTVTISSLISFWLIPFLERLASSTTNQTDVQIKCSKGGISLFDLKYNSSSSYLSGKIENTGLVSLKDLFFQIIYANSTIERIGLCYSEDVVIACEYSNLTLLPRNLISFSFQVPDNYETITIETSCSSYGVYDIVKKEEVSQE
ncbi:MAG: archaellin/type IV pilin N-terminal domain-containing protein, partial [Candidatus Aenigmatarchaeota archaeon]